MAWVVVAVIKMRRDDRDAFNKQIAERDAQNKELMNQLINKCPTCDLAKAANKSLIDED
ncbi:MAG: hypothetical protein RR719_00790 [Akkermansia sp.]